MKGLEDQNVVIDTEFSLSALEDVMKWRFVCVQLMIYLWNWRLSYAYQGYVTDWFECSILNFTIGPVVFYVCVELYCKKWCVCLSLPVR